MQKTLLTFVVVVSLATISACSKKAEPNTPTQNAAKSTDAQGVGVVNGIDSGKGTITLQHQAIPAIGWPAMTMAFRADPPELLKAARVGDTVQFTVHPAGMDSTLTSIRRVPKQEK